MFYDILERKNAFLSYNKTIISKSRNIDIFPKGLVHGFGPELAIFPLFWEGNIGQENVFYDVLKKQKRFSSLQKKKKLKKWKN